MKNLKKLHKEELKKQMINKKSKNLQIFQFSSFMVHVQPKLQIILKKFKKFVKLQRLLVQKKDYFIKERTNNWLFACLNIFCTLCVMRYYQGENEFLTQKNTKNLVVLITKVNEYIFLICHIVISKNAYMLVISNYNY